MSFMPRFPRTRNGNCLPHRPDRPEKGRHMSYDLIVLSHLRWGFVWQRPQHLMSRWAREHRVFFFEEPVETEGAPWLEVEKSASGVHVVKPHVARGLDLDRLDAVQQTLLDELFV